MGQIQVSAVFPTIAKERQAEFKDLAAEALKITMEDPGNLQYDWFFSQDESRCVVRETYVSSEAILAHLAMVGDVLGRLVDAGGGLEVELFGDPSPELLQAAEPFNTKVYAFFQSK